MRAALVGAAAFGRDQLGQPADLAVDRFQPVLLQLQGVAVQPLPGAGQRGPHAVGLLGHPLLATLQDLQPDVGPGLGEERQPGAEALVVVGLRTDLGQQLGEVLLALGGEPVDPLAALGPGTEAGTGRLLLQRLLLVDPAGLGQPAQRRVERTVGEGPERAEQRGQPLAQLVAVHGRLAEQSENRDLQHPVPLSGAAVVHAAGSGAASGCDISRRYIMSMYRAASRTVPRVARRSSGGHRRCR